MALRTGLMGAGWFGREAHLRNLMKIADVEVTAISTRSDSGQQAAREICGDSLACYSDWRDVINADVDAVIVALTNDQHCEAAVAALEAGKHVLCEKPLGLSISECRQVIEAAEGAGRILQIGHEMRHQALYQKMKGMVTDGIIGDARIMWCREYRGPMRPGWRSSEALTGGMLLEKNCHHFDLFNWIFDSVPVRVSAFGGRDVLSEKHLLLLAQGQSMCVCLHLAVLRRVNSPEPCRSRRRIHGRSDGPDAGCRAWPHLCRCPTDPPCWPGGFRPRRGTLRCRSSQSAPNYV